MNGNPYPKGRLSGHLGRCYGAERGFRNGMLQERPYAWLTSWLTYMPRGADRILPMNVRPAHGNELAATLLQAWHLLSRAAHDRQSPLRTPMLGHCRHPGRACRRHPAATTGRSPRRVRRPVPRRTAWPNPPVPSTTGSATSCGSRSMWPRSSGCGCILRATVAPDSRQTRGPGWCPDRDGRRHGAPDSRCQCRPASGPAANVNPVRPPAPAASNAGTTRR